MSSAMIRLWDTAADIDPTLKVRGRDMPVLSRKFVKTLPYSRARMFERMARGEVSLFTDLKVPVRCSPSDDLRNVLTNAIGNGFPKSKSASIQIGRAGKRSRMKVPELISRWRNGRTILSVTDLHFRKTKFDELLDTSNLSNFNILCNDSEFGPEFMTLIEMMTLVVSSAGNLTDNHADDCDGTNHCFVGKKLWLAWDRVEGKATGFQDVDRDTVMDQAAFDMQAFLSLPSARWFTVEPNQTLFLPGSLAHKVITLEHYIGVGSFHVALPSYLRCLERWLLLDSHDIVPKGLLCKIHKAVLRKLTEIGGTHAKEQARWGLKQLRNAVRRWEVSKDAEIKTNLLKNRMFAQLVQTVS